jgi:hypothetical protein
VGCHKLPTSKADVQQIVGEQNELNKTTAPDISENSQPLSLVLLYFQTVLSVAVQETNWFMQNYAMPDFPHSQQIVKGLYAFLTVVAQMDHDCKPRMKLQSEPTNTSERRF